MHAKRPSPVRSHVEAQLSATLASLGFSDVVIKLDPWRCKRCTHCFPEVPSVAFVAGGAGAGAGAGAGEISSVPDPSLATLEALRRVDSWDPDLRDVASLASLVDTVSSFGARDVPRTLGHPIIMQRVMRYLDTFMCPTCDPTSFGIARRYAAGVMDRGWLRFSGAAALVQKTMDMLLPASFLRRPRYFKFGRIQRLDLRHCLRPRVAYAVSQLELAKCSVSLGMESSWFDDWEKL